MKYLVVIFIFLCNIANADNMLTNDYGVFIAESKFDYKCVIKDPGLSGSEQAIIYYNEYMSCHVLEKLYIDTYKELTTFLAQYNYINVYNTQKHITIRILTIAELNNPDNFSGTEKTCMNGRTSKCKNGVYVGRTFYSPVSNNINVYVTYNLYRDQYGFVPTMKHELMHAILYRYGLHERFDNIQEHSLIIEFLDWIKNHNNAFGK